MQSTVLQQQKYKTVNMISERFFFRYLRLKCAGVHLNTDTLF